MKSTRDWLISEIEEQMDPEQVQAFALWALQHVPDAVIEAQYGETAEEMQDGEEL